MAKGVYIRKPVTQKTRDILSRAHLGQKAWNKGLGKPLPRCPVCNKELGDMRSLACREHGVFGRKIGGKASAETRLKMSSMRQKENNANWKGGKEFRLNKWREKRRFWALRRVARKKSAEGFHSYDEWVNLKRRCGNMCLCCFKKESEVLLTEDHIVPLIKGGTDYIDNIQPLCMRCNSKKHTKTIRYPQLVTCA